LKIKNFSDWKFEKKFQAEIGQGKIDNQKVILAKPQTFMNNSGQAVKSLRLNYLQKHRKIKAMAVILRRFNNLWVIHDDIDLPLGKIKIVKNRGAAGHKGVQSIIDELGTKNFVRFRIGINRFAQNQKSKIKNKKLDKFVLQKFNKEEEKILKKIIKKTVEAIEFALNEGLEKAMQEYNK